MLLCQRKCSCKRICYNMYDCPVSLNWSRIKSLSLSFMATARPLTYSTQEDTLFQNLLWLTQGLKTNNVIQVTTIQILGMLRLQSQHINNKTILMDQTKYCTELQIKGLITWEAYFLLLEYHDNIRDWSPENNWTGLSPPIGQPRHIHTENTKTYNLTADEKYLTVVVTNIQDIIKN